MTVSVEKARQEMLEASEVVEALRLDISRAADGEKEDKPIVAAWDLALNHLRERCAQWVFAVEALEK